VYVSEEAFQPGIIGHEMSHAIISRYFGIPAPVKVQEVLSMYVEYNLRDGSAKEPVRKRSCQVIKILVDKKFDVSIIPIGDIGICGLPLIVNMDYWRFYTFAGPKKRAMSRFKRSPGSRKCRLNTWSI